MIENTDNNDNEIIIEKKTTNIDISIDSKENIATTSTTTEHIETTNETTSNLMTLSRSTSDTSIKHLEKLLSLDDDNDELPQTHASNDDENKQATPTLSKKEILGVLLVDSFSNFYITQDNILGAINENPIGNGNGDNKQQDGIGANNNNNFTSPTSIIGNGYKDYEVTSFLMNAFLYLSIPISVLNYLLLTNITPINNNVSSQQTTTSVLSKVSSFSSIASLSPNLDITTGSGETNQLISPISNSPTLDSVQTSNNDDSSTTTTTTATKTKENILPIKVDKHIILELEMLYDHHYSMEIFEYSKKISQAQNDIASKSKLYFQYLSDLTKRSLAICPPKYTNQIESTQFYSTIRESMEFFLVQNLFHYLFQVDYDKDLQFNKRIESLKFIEPLHLGISNSTVFNKELSITLMKLNVYQTPIDKQRCLARTLVKLLKMNSAEETLLPNLVYLILVSNPPNIYSNFKFLEKFIDIETQNPIYEYAFLLFSTAIQFIEKLNHNHLSIDPLYFQSKIFEYQQLNNIVIVGTGSGDTNETTTTGNQSNLSAQFSSLLINDPEYNLLLQQQHQQQHGNTGGNGNGGNLNNFLCDNENRFKLFKEGHRIQSIIELCKSQITDNEIEELLLKFISISLIKENPSYHSLIRYSLKRFFIYYLGIDKNIFLATEMHTIGALQDDNSSSPLNLLPQNGKDNNNQQQQPINTGGDNDSNNNIGNIQLSNSTNKDRAIKTAKIAGAAVTGAVLVGITGGLAAPFVGMMLNFVGAGSIVAGITGATGLSSATMLSVIFGAAGAKVSAGAMISATSGIKDYSIHKIKSQTSLHAIIGVYGLCNDGGAEYNNTNAVWDRVVRNVTDDYGDIFIVEWEKEVMLKLKAIVSEYQGTIVQGLVRSAATNIISQSLASALVPLSVLKAASVIDNPWSLLKDRSEKAGKVLAQQIIDGYFGNRPLTLISTSMGSRMVFYALEELYQRSITNPMVYSLIESVVFIGSPITSDPKRWSKILKLVSGRLINCYTPNDMLLKYICRSVNCLSDGILPAAGVTPIHIGGSSLVIENVDLSNLVKSHLDYEREDILVRILQHIDINGIKYCLPKISPLFSGKVFDL